MRTDPTMQLLDAIEAARDGEDLMIRCPAHDDGTASLHVTQGRSGVILHDHAGCDTGSILRATNLSWSNLFNKDPDDTSVKGEWTPRGTASNIYPYFDETGTLLFEVCRVPEGNGRKSFMQRRPDPANADRWIWNLTDTRRVLYRLPQIIEAVRAGRTIYIPEGEKDVDSLVSLSLDATTSPGGAGKWRDEYTPFLAGADIIIIADADSTGRAHARSMRDQLVESGCSVAITEAPPPYKDVTALLEHGGSVSDLMTTVRADDEKRAKFGVDVLDIVLRKATATDWVVPGVMARRERLLLTGFEGHGKTTLRDQMAVMAAAGISWFSHQPMPPQKCLVIDAENEPGQRLADWQKMVKLAEYYGEGIARGQLIVLEEWDNTELDMADPTGTSWLHERVTAYEPDIVFMGPLTNLVGRDLRDDEPVRRLKNAVNSARAICGSAFVMEHHAPHKGPGDKQRSVRPYGSSMFLKWPDYGYGLAPMADQPEGNYLWQRTRWPRVRSRAWPAALRWGREDSAEWPWVETEPPE